jgi:4'-phosphopantetheinyl transferase
MPQLREFLSAAEQHRAAKFLQAEDASRFILGRAMIRCLCAQRFDLQPARVPLEISSRGKPRLGGAHAEALQFNLAHSGNFVVAAWTPERTLGIDIEHARPSRIRPYAELGRRAFSSEELNVLVQAPEEAAAEIFYSIWVRKEAILKAEGCGLANALQEFSVVRRTRQVEWIPEVVFPGGKTWNVEPLDVHPDYPAAIACEDPFTVNWAPVSTYGMPVPDNR